MTITNCANPPPPLPNTVLPTYPSSAWESRWTVTGGLSGNRAPVLAKENGLMF